MYSLGAPEDAIAKAYHVLLTELGYPLEQFEENNDMMEAESIFLQNGKNDVVLKYLEALLNTMWANSKYSRNDLLTTDQKLRRILREERILLRLRPEHNYLVKKSKARRTRASNGYDPHKYKYIRFESLGDETVIEADREIRVLQQNARWKEPLEGYNKAWNQYQEGNFNQHLADALYRSLEEVCQMICVELEDWNDESDTVGTYLGTMREKGLFDPNDSMVGEWQNVQGGLKDILDGIEKTQQGTQMAAQRTGGDRTGHVTFDQDYALLLLHQVSAFLSFIIKRYESNYGE